MRLLPAFLIILLGVHIKCLVAFVSEVNHDFIIHLIRTCMWSRPAARLCHYKWMQTYTLLCVALSPAIR